MNVAKKKEDPIPEMSAVDQVLSDAHGADDVIVICVHDGEISVVSSITYPPDILWSLEMAKANCLEIGNDYTEQ
jgi:hypothetical protein